MVISGPGNCKSLAPEGVISIRGGFSPHGHPPGSAPGCRLTVQVFDNISENRVQKLDSLGKELREGGTDTFIMFQMKPKTLSWNRSPTEANPTTY